MPIRFRTLLFVAALLGAIGPFATARGVLAQNAANISVSANIASAVSFTACDTTANFGDGLNALGAPKAQGDDLVTQSARGDSSIGEGTIYIWHPSCPADVSLVQLETTLPYQVEYCGTESSGTSSLSIAGGDLGLANPSHISSSPTYHEADSTVKFEPRCIGWFGSSAPGTQGIDLVYTLRVNFGDSPGTFIANTTFNVIT